VSRDRAAGGRASRKPDFFIVGAPKAGTKAMVASLQQHPEIGMCPVKEIHVFGRDLGIPSLGSEADYLLLFRGIESKKRLGESSVWYLYSRTAPVRSRRSTKKPRSSSCFASLST
jgi:hypothetical protein